MTRAKIAQTEVLRQDWALPRLGFSTFHFPLSTFYPNNDATGARLGACKIGIFPFSIFHFPFFSHNARLGCFRSTFGTPWSLLQRMMENGKMENPNLAAARLGLKLWFHISASSKCENGKMENPNLAAARLGLKLWFHINASSKCENGKMGNPNLVAARLGFLLWFYINASSKRR